jgi:hypothetical protein
MEVRVEPMGDGEHNMERLIEYMTLTLRIKAENEPEEVQWTMPARGTT